MAEKHHWRYSLKQKITLTTLAIFIVGICALSYYVTRMLRGDVQNLLADQQISAVSFVAADINHELEDRVKVLENVARLIDPPRLGNRAALQQMLEEHSILRNFFNGGILVLSIDGTCVAEIPLTAGRRGTNYFDNDADHIALTEGKSAISRPMMERKLRQPLFNIATPIRDARGRVIGALVGVINLAQPNFLDTIGGHRHGKSSSYLVIAPQHNLIVTATDKNRVLQPLPAPGINRLLDKRMQGFDGPEISINSLGVENLSSVRRVPVADWFVVATLPTAEAFAPIHDMQQRIVFATILLTLLMGTISWWLLRRQFSPLVATVESLAGMSGASKPLQPLPIAKEDEIGHLVGSFNRLLETLRQREAQLETERDFFSALLRQSSDGVFLFSPDDLSILEANPSLCKMLGYERDELLGLKLNDLVDAPLDAVRENVRQTIQSRRHLVGERNYLGKDGARIIVEVNTAVVETGGRQLIMGNLRDITERKRKEDEYHSIIQASIDGFWITDFFGRILDANGSICRMLGYSREELLRMSIRDIDADESPKETAARIRKMIQTGGAQFQARHRRKDGAVIDVEVSVVCVAALGQRFFAFVRDITERKQADEELRESEARYRAVASSAKDAIVTGDATEYIVGWNPGARRMFGYAESEAIGQPLTLLVPQRFLDRHPDGMKWAPTIGERHLAGRTVELVGLRKDASEFPLELSLAEWETREGHFFTAIIRDITERRRAEAARAELESQLRESQKMEALGTLAGGVAHDFNNVLAVIMGNVELVCQDLGPAHASLGSLEEISKASRRAKNLVQQILAFSRRQVLERKVILLAPVIEESVHLLRATLPAGVSMSMECAADAPAVLADATQIQQVLLNLCSNAWQAMQGRERPGTIEIGLEAHDQAPGEARDARTTFVRGSLRPGRYTCLSVRDNGSGMDPATVARIFEPFFTTKPVGVGTGLGLAVVHGILQEHEASVEVHSELGEGTTFRIYFPAVDAPVPAAPEQRPNPVSKDWGDTPAKGGKHILYVDDDEAIVLLMTHLLERKGYRVSGYIDAREALAAARAEPGRFDLAVTDHNMPGMSGLEVASALREIRADLPVALASGYITDELREKAPAAGVRELIYKPNTVDELCDTVARLANIRQADGNSS